MAKRTPPFPAYPEWTEARFWSFIRSALRKAYMKWPPQYDEAVGKRREVLVKKGNQKYEYQCTKCKQWFKQKDTQKDHTIPTGALNKFGDAPDFIRKMFCSSANIRRMCKPCHQIKTKEERNG